MRADHVLFGRGWFWAAAGCVVLVAGCAKQNAPAQPDVARQSLETALAIWKSGESPEALARLAPPITVGDYAWRTGRKLLGYRLLDDARDDGVNLHYVVELSLADEEGGTLPEQVSYVVGTKPTITIFRD